MQVLLALGEGEVTTYADVAATAGYPRHARLVGRILATAHRDHPELELPWWRVVNATGHLRVADPTEQAELLRGEGVTVRDARVISAPIGRFARGAAITRPDDGT